MSVSSLASLSPAALKFQNLTTPSTPVVANWSRFASTGLYATLKIASVNHEM